MSYEVEKMGSFHVGGRQVTLADLPTRKVSWSPGMTPVDNDPNGDFQVEQMYVQYVKLARPLGHFPLLLWHGGGHTGAIWESRPDGQPGWQDYFLHAGYDVYVSDAVERGRASWARYPEIFASEPLFRSKREAWELFRIGPQGSYCADPAARIANPGQRFPVTAFDHFTMQSVPRWLDNDTPTQAAYNALVERVGPCVLLVHSQGGNFGFNAALIHPDNIKAVVAIEPAGAPAPDHPGLSRLKDIPHLFLWGDYLDDYPMWRNNIVKASARYHEALCAQGTPSQWLELPQQGISGNTHMLMMDTNATDIAAIIEAWMDEQGLRD
ncbi:MAG: pimeloyl-ACP methyl ester carboxylesterase [Gammaproteobacteria bacterium]|jgi:pimeloyl-ACP methyl ester carboxylesterase